MQFQRRLENKKEELVLMLQREVETLNERLEGYQQLSRNYETLSDNFQNNVRAIQQLQEENRIIRDKANELNSLLIQQNKEMERMQFLIDEERSHKEQLMNTTMKFEQSQNKLQKLRDEANHSENRTRDLTHQHQKQVLDLESKHKLEIQKVSQLAAQTIALKESQQQKVYYSFKAESEKIIGDLKHTNSMLLNNNTQCNTQISQLKEEVLRLSTLENEKEQRLQRLVKEQHYNAEIYEKQMDSLKTSHDAFETTLKEKVHNLQKEKERIVLEFKEADHSNKQKRKELKEQFNKRMEQLASEKDTEMRRDKETVRDLQLEYSKAQYTIQELRKDQLELERIKRSKAQNIEEKNNFYAKALEEDKRYFKNELSLKQSKIHQLEQEIKSLEKQLTDSQAITNQLKAKQMLAEQKQTQKKNMSSQQNVSIRDSEWEYQKRMPGNSLELIALKKEKEILESQIKQLQGAIIKLANESRQDLESIERQLDEKQKQITKLKRQIQSYQGKDNEKTNEINLLKNQINSQIINFERLELNLRQIEILRKGDVQSAANLSTQITSLALENKQLLQEIDSLNEERDALIQISNELRAEIENKEVTIVEPMKRISISNISKISDEPRNIPMSPSFIEVVPQIKERRGPMIDLIRLKKQRERGMERMERMERDDKIQITAKQSTLNEPVRRHFNQQIDSQKDVYSRLKSKSHSRSPQYPDRDNRRKFQQTNSQKERYAQIKRSNERKRAYREEQEEEKPKTGLDFNRLYEEEERKGQQQRQYRQSDDNQ